MKMTRYRINTATNLVGRLNVNSRNTCNEFLNAQFYSQYNHTFDKSSIKPYALWDSTITGFITLPNVNYNYILKTFLFQCNWCTMYLLRIPMAHSHSINEALTVFKLKRHIESSNDALVIMKRCHGMSSLWMLQNPHLSLLSIYYNQSQSIQTTAKQTRIWEDLFQSIKADQ